METCCHKLFRVVPHKKRKLLFFLILGVMAVATVALIVESHSFIVTRSKHVVLPFTHSGKKSVWRHREFSNTRYVEAAHPSSGTLHFVGNDHSLLDDQDVSSTLLARQTRDQKQDETTEIGQNNDILTTPEGSTSTQILSENLLKDKRDISRYMKAAANDSRKKDFANVENLLRKSNQYHKRISLGNKDAGFMKIVNFSSVGKWVPLDRTNPGMFVYAAYYDDVERVPFVRLLLSIQMKTIRFKVVCLYFERQQNILKYTGQTLGFCSSYLREKFRYNRAFIECPLPAAHKTPYAVSVIKSEVTMKNDVTRLADYVTTVHRLQYGNNEMPESSFSALGSHSIPSTTDTPQAEEHDSENTHSEHTLNTLSERTGNTALKYMNISHIEHTQNSLSEHLKNAHREDTDNNREHLKNTLSEHMHNTQSERLKNTHRKHTVNTHVEHNGQTLKWNITQCYPCFHGYSDFMQLIQQVEISRMFGVEHFVFYVRSVQSNAVTAVLQIYRQMGVAEVHDWRYPPEMQDGVYFHQKTAIQDCLYRHTRTSRFLLFGDFDEIFVPRATSHLLPILTKQFSHNPQCGSLQFLNTFYEVNPRSSYDVNTLPDVSFLRHYNLTMLLRQERLNEIWEPRQRSKLAVLPARISVLQVHYTTKFRGDYEECPLPATEALLQHYRTGLPGPLKPQHGPAAVGFLVDSYLAGFAEPIVRRVKAVLDKLSKY